MSWVDQAFSNCTVSTEPKGCVDGFDRDLVELFLYDYWDKREVKIPEAVGSNVIAEVMKDTPIGILAEIGIVIKSK